MAFNYDLDRLKEIMQSFYSLTGLRLNIFDSDCNRLFAYPNVYCKFCEYVVLEGTDDAVEDEYVDLLLKEMQMYSKILKGKRIVGYDL
ncbi:MAG: PocR ligand-binding domain-containing protein, partial [Clostridia bacterium]|nr:PocR ligand-binding domain-containing protein [Clostridia bacterium]